MTPIAFSQLYSWLSFCLAPGPNLFSHLDNTTISGWKVDLRGCVDPWHLPELSLTLSSSSALKSLSCFNSGFQTQTLVLDYLVSFWTSLEVLFECLGYLCDSNFFLRKVDLLTVQFLNNFFLFWLCLKNRRCTIF